jgi:vacuolar-type H+-ATPase subunit I/STV1
MRYPVYILKREDLKEGVRFVYRGTDALYEEAGEIHLSFDENSIFTHVRPLNKDAFEVIAHRKLRQREIDRILSHLGIYSLEKSKPSTQLFKQANVKPGYARPV